jgi:hypothetical protein
MAEVGKYRRRVQLIALSQGRSTYGVWYTDPVLNIECWAYRRKQKSDFGRDNYSDHFANTYYYEIYYNSGVVVDTNMILKDGTDEFKIVSIEIQGDKKVTWLLTCTLKTTG